MNNNTPRTPSLASRGTFTGHDAQRGPTEATKPPEKRPEVLGQSQTTRLEAVHSSSRMSTQGAHFASQNA